MTVRGTEFHLRSGFYAAVVLHAVPQVPLVLCRQSSKSIECRHWEVPAALLLKSGNAPASLVSVMYSKRELHNLLVPTKHLKTSNVYPQRRHMTPYKSYTWKNTWMSGPKGSETKCQCTVRTADNHGKPSLLLIPPVRIRTAAVSTQDWRKHQATPINSTLVIQWGYASLFPSLVLMNLIRQSFWQKILLLFMRSLFQLHSWEIALFYIASYKVTFNVLELVTKPTDKTNKIKIGS